MSSHGEGPHVGNGDIDTPADHRVVDAGNLDRDPAFGMARHDAVMFGRALDQDGHGAAEVVLPGGEAGLL